MPVVFLYENICQPLFLTVNPDSFKHKQLLLQLGIYIQTNVYFYTMLFAPSLLIVWRDGVRTLGVFGY